MELSRKDTKMIQGLSVLAMLCLHLFDRWNWDGLYTPILVWGGVPLTYMLGQLSDFCVMGFAFCSGYAHFTLFGSNGFYKKRLRSLLDLLCSYWVVLIVFSLVSILVGQGERMPGSLITFIGNAALLHVTYNGAWWYMWAYALLVLISPILMKFVKEHQPGIVLLAGFAVYCAAYYVRFQMTDTGWLLSRFGPFGMTIFEYLIGAEAAHGKWLTHMFFYSVLFENLVFMAKYPLLVYLYMLALTVAVSILLTPLQKKLKQLIIRG